MPWDWLAALASTPDGFLLNEILQMGRPGESWASGAPEKTKSDPQTVLSQPPGRTSLSNVPLNFFRMVSVFLAAVAMLNSKNMPLMQVTAGLWMLPSAAAMPRLCAVTEKPARAQARRGAPPVAVTLGLSLLEAASVVGAARHQYRSRMEQLVKHCREFFLDWDDDLKLDEILVDMFSMMYYEGANADEGEKVLAALAFYLPRFARKGSGCLPRAARAVKGWMKLSPPRQRLPLPRSVMYSLAGCFLSDGDVLMALCLIISFSAYLRPCEARALLVRHLVPPVRYPCVATAMPQRHGMASQDWSSSALRAWGLLLHDADLGIPGKTGALDDSVLLDNLLMLNPFFEIIRRHRAEDEVLFNFDFKEFGKKFAAKCAGLQLEPLAPSLYALRHGGASEDL